jgi:hypothetical protein
LSDKAIQNGVEIFAIALQASGRDIVVSSHAVLTTVLDQAAYHATSGSFVHVASFPARDALAMAATVNRLFDLLCFVHAAHRFTFGLVILRNIPATGQELFYAVGPLVYGER